ncbi:MAG: S8 family serine peptidase [Planctomycetia bacterium]|nr:MAG: S8 family serine peptidase [Planctomycetia bacterium]
MSFARRFLFSVCLISIVGWGRVQAAEPVIRWRTGTQTLPRQSVEQVKAKLLELAGVSATEGMQSAGAVKAGEGSGQAGAGSSQAGAAAQANAAGSAHVIVQFETPVTRAMREQLTAGGLTLQSYLGDNAYFAHVDGSKLNAELAAQVPGFSRVAPIHLEAKLHPDLAAGEIVPWSVVPRDGVVKLKGEGDESPALGDAGKLWAATEDDLKDPFVAAYVIFHPDVSLEDGVAKIHELDGRVMSYLYTINGLVVELPYANLKVLGLEDSVQWIEPPLPPMGELNAENRVRTGANIVQAAPYNLTGAGVKVMVYDGGKIRTTHQDFQGRGVIGASEPACSTVSDHATHVSGTIGGAGVANANNKGMAPGVDIVSYGFQQSATGTTCPSLSAGFLYTDPGDALVDYTNAFNVAGAVISNNSIGTNTAPNGFNCAWEGDYGAMDILIDSMVRGSLGQPIRVVWANGNERSSGRCGTTYRTTAPPACAKNHITVGALNSNDDSVTSFTSWGPADDDRMKPDLSAPGCQVGGDAGVTSCGSASDTAYTSKCGTSMASPTVCGLSALLLQDYRAQFPGNPDFRNSTLKILLAHTAVDLFNPGPDYQTGYGSVRIQPAVDFMRTGNFLENTVSGTGETFQAVVIVSPLDTQLKVTLAWDDVPGTANTIPELVNDLDLRVFDASNTQYYPWTLGGIANPAAPAVRTQRNSVDNIEQVVIDAPAPGAYRVEVHGFNVPQGPQPFSLCASPLLVNCSSQGTMSLDRTKYACASTATLRVVDCDLNTDDGSVQTVNVSIASTTEPGGETVTLTETAAESATFVGSINLATSDSAGVLHIANGDTVTATYVDADDGNGGFNVNVTANATVDCDSPIISNVAVSNIEPRNATITFTTNEPCRATVNYGTSCGSLTGSASSQTYNTSHTFDLSNLTIATTYFFSVSVEDQAANTATDDNGGSCHTFTTEDLPELYTEQFTGGADSFDLDNSAYLFQPDGSIDFYSVCRASPVNALPTDPAGGTVVTLANNASTPIVLGPGHNVLLYGVSYGTVHIGSNGYLTFTAGDTDSTETLADHFDTPRVSGLFDDLNPALAGAQISYKELADRFVVTYLNVPKASTTNTNTFQIEMYYDGRIQIAYLGVDVLDAIVGLSGGGNLSPDFFESDFSSFGNCGPRPPSAAGLTVEVPMDRQVPINLIAGDDGIPNPQLEYIITSLPTYELRDAGNNQVIASVPYTLVANGNQVLYQPTGGYIGSDSFTFKANDGGTAPDGGDSNVATVTLNVLPVLTIPFSDEFPTTTFDSQKWYTVSNATIDSTTPINPPSPPYAARFNGDPAGTDSIVTHLFDLSGGDPVRLTYSWQVRGNGETPDTGDDLFIEYRDSGGNWQILQQHLGSLPDMTTFNTTTMLLPPGALHSSFRLRIRNIGTAGNFDDWLVDDVRLVPENAPVAVSTVHTTGSNTPITIGLVASDPNMDPLTYTIQSLPSIGTLRDPVTGTIASAPHTLSGSSVEFLPGPGVFSGNTSFTFNVTDGQHTSNTATVSITIGGPQPVHVFNLDTDPGWIGDAGPGGSGPNGNGWAWGVPNNSGGSCGTGRANPTSGFTGSNVYGYNLIGCYTNNLTPTRWLTTTAIDCSNITQVQLRFKRWLGIESATFDKAYIEVSTNGTTWTPVWTHSGGSFTEQAWTSQSYDVPAADNQPTVYIRWGMGVTDSSVTYQGWNIDDVEIWGDVPSACTNVLRGDVNNDGQINGGDVALFTQAYLDENSVTPAQKCAADTVVNDAIDDADVAKLVEWMLAP